MLFKSNKKTAGLDNNYLAKERLFALAELTTMPRITSKILSLLLILSCSQYTLKAQSHSKEEGFTAIQFQNTSCLSDQDRTQIQAHLQQQITFLKAKKLLSEVQQRDVTLLQWPLKSARGFEGYSYHTISNFVDRDQNFPNQIQDYNCGSRSYDTPSGYNHAGTDFSIWPKPWELMEKNVVEVIAAEAGVIIDKQDGNFDKSCSLNNKDPWNAIYIRHADGTVAWYGHLKSNSLTSKGIGSNVERGEYLGIVGSSGASTAPHLHFELQEEDGTIIDPFLGACSDASEKNWWEDQRPYFDSGINLLEVSRQLPEEPFCSDPVIEKDTTPFCSGDELYFTSYIRDLRSQQTLYHTILKPDNSIFREWENTSPGNQDDYFSASYISEFFRIPDDPQPGEWKYNVTYLDNSYTQTFNICAKASNHAKSPVRLQNLFPNPATIDLKLNLKINEEESLWLEVTDLVGRQRISKRRFYHIGQHEYILPVDELERGVYIITIRGTKTDFDPIVKRFVKH